MTKLTRNEKEKILEHYIGTICVCGKGKLAHRWLCLHCKFKQQGSEEELEVDKYCNLHLLAAQKVLRKAQDNATK